MNKANKAPKTSQICFFLLRKKVSIKLTQQNVGAQCGGSNSEAFGPEKTCRGLDRVVYTHSLKLTAKAPTRLHHPKKDGCHLLTIHF